MRAFLLMILAIGLLFGCFAFGSFFPEFADVLKGGISRLAEKNSSPPPVIENSGKNAETKDSAEPSPAGQVIPEKPKTAESGKIGEEKSGPQTEVDAKSEDEDNVNEEVIKGNIAKGDTPGKLFGEWCQEDMAEKYIKAVASVFPSSGFRLGHPYTVWRDPQNEELKRFEYEIDSKRMLVATSEGEKVSAGIEPIKYDIALQLVRNTIENSLFQAVTDKGEKASLAMLLADIFGWEINFIRDVQEGDSFSVLLEKRYRDGMFKGYGRVLGASFTNKGKKYEAFLFRDSSGAYRHFNSKGENLKKTLLQAPLSLTRVTSTFSKARRHPIMGGLRPHLGVDYAAPIGTPVKAVGDGRITHRGWVGGYGHQLIVKHGSGLESMYSHLSRYAKGIAPGSRVRQGQVIAFVGNTGYSTGPHLDFRLKQGNKFINPQKAVNPRGAAVPQNKKKEFTAKQAVIRSYMQGKTDLKNYEVGMF